MDTSTYIDIRVLNQKKAVEYFPHILKAVHFSVWEGVDLAVSFPTYNDAVSNDFGHTVRVFGSVPQLTEFYMKLVSIVRKDGLAISEIMPTPQVTEFVGFTRDRSFERNTPSNLRRRMQRAAARGETYMPKEVAHPVHVLKVPSVSTRGAFNLYIRKVTEVMEGGCNYGLGKLVPQFQA